MAELNRSISAFQNDSLGTEDAVGISRKIEIGEVDLPTVTRDAIKRAKSVNSQLNAIAFEDFNNALIRSSLPVPGQFHGVPTFIKDTDEVNGIPLYLGSRALPGKKSRRFSKAAKQLLDTGLNHLGTTTTPEFGMTGTTESLKLAQHETLGISPTLLAVHQVEVRLWWHPAQSRLLMQMMVQAQFAYRLRAAG